MIFIINNEVYTESQSEPSQKNPCGEIPLNPAWDYCQDDVQLEMVYEFS